MKKKSNFAAKDILEVFGLALIFLGIGRKDGEEKKV